MWIKGFLFDRPEWEPAPKVGRPRVIRPAPQRPAKLPFLRERTPKEGQIETRR